MVAYQFQSALSPKGQRFDYLTIDAEDHYLLSGHLGPGILYVVDMRTNKLVKAIPVYCSLSNMVRGKPLRARTIDSARHPFSLPAVN